jgi:hypothetical protein
MKALDTLAQSTGRGLMAGFIGTAVMTVSSTVEARLRGRPPSTAPARATAKVLGIEEFADERALGLRDRDRHRVRAAEQPAR